MGHHDYLRTGQPFVFGERVFCIDTGCCTGGPLTGLLLPEFRLLSVPSRANYREQARAQYRRDRAGSGVTQWDRSAERLLETIYRHVIERHTRLMVQLQSEVGLDRLSDREQARAYAAQASEGLLANLLHLARKGELSLASLRQRLA